MNYEALFTLANASVMPAWLLLAFFPKSRATRLVAHSFLYPVLLAVCYLALLIVTLGGEGGMGSLAEVRHGFSRDGVLLLGWIHYLVFDLFIGAWMVRDAASRDIRHSFIIPSLFLTLMLGPIGLMTYVAIRWWQTRSLLL